MRVRRTLAALLAVPTLLLAGCGGGSSVADPPGSSSPTSSPPTTRPPARESPQHFIRRWADAEKQMENTGKTKQYLALSKGCDACRKLARTVSRYYSAGGYIRWNGWTISSITKYPASGSAIAFAVHSNSAPTDYKTSKSDSTKHLRGGSIAYVLQLEPPRGPYTVTAKAQLDRSR
jgi:hypothetical protein